jgi:hypothetical protein
MSHSLRPGVWASCIACLALTALSTGIALAQQEEQQTSDQASRQSASESQQQNDEQERQRQQQEQQDRQRNEQDDQDEDQNQQDRQREQRDRQREQQEQQRDQQDRQRDDQSWQRDQQARQRGERERSVQINRQDRSRIGTQDQRSRFPEPNRDGQFSRQQIGRDSQFSREGQFRGEAQRSGRFGQQDGQIGQQQYDVYSERQSRQFDSGGSEDAGLGVNVISEGGEGSSRIRPPSRWESRKVIASFR